MSDFTSEFWSWFIITLALGGIAGLVILLRSNSKVTLKKGETAEVTGHVWDGDLQELNNPLPMWWLVMFYLSIVFALGYLVLYPGLGNYAGVLKWTQIGEYQAEMDHADEKFGPLFAAYAQQDLPTLAKNETAMKSGRRLYLSYCAVCHGSDARGSKGFPNLRDSAWLWGGEPEQIKTSISQGRNSTMPAWNALGEETVDNLTEYVMSLSGRKVDQVKADAGKTFYPTMCGVCHGADATGNPLMGASNLTDKRWVYGGSPRAIKASIAEGRNGIMPAHKDFLGEDKVHVLSAYIMSLSEAK